MAWWVRFVRDSKAPACVVEKMGKIDGVPYGAHAHLLHLKKLGTAEVKEHVLALDFDELSEYNIHLMNYVTVLRKVVRDSDTRSNATRSEI